jgi:DNA-binding Lrp family transcriptional regulator
MSHAAKAHILVECAVGKTKDVIQALSQLKNVKSVEMVVGPYDLIAVVEATTLEEIGDIVTMRFHRIIGVTWTVTLSVPQVPFCKPYGKSDSTYTGFFLVTFRDFALTPVHW